MSFFIRPNKNAVSRNVDKKVGRKRKNRAHRSSTRNKNGAMGEELSSASEDEDKEAMLPVDPSPDEETVQEKRLRLAKEYLKEIENQERENVESEDVDLSALEHRLRDDVLEQTGKLYKQIADNCQPINLSNIRVLKGHKMSPVCLVISPDDKYCYSAAKDYSLIKWCCSTGKRIKVIKGFRNTAKDVHSGLILCLAISSDNKFLAAGCNNNVIYIFDPTLMTIIHTFKGHRDVVSGLAFRKGTHQLFSASHDRSVKVWNLDEMVYVESLFGHQDAITAIDALGRERAITAGGRDNTVRIWKIVEESQVVFNGHKGTIDCVRLMNEENFLTCGDDGLLAVWGVQKKRPLATVSSAHGLNKENGLPNWIASVATLTSTDLAASAGSSDGKLCFWKCDLNARSISLLHSVPMCGFVNALQFSNKGDFLVAAVGQEHRLGRWWRIKEAKNTLCIIPLCITSQT